MTLGVLQLENTPLTHAGCMGNQASFRYPVLYQTVPGGGGGEAAHRAAGL